MRITKMLLHGDVLEVLSSFQNVSAVYVYLPLAD